MTQREIFEELEAAFVEFSKGCSVLHWDMSQDSEMLEAVYAFMQGWDEEEIL